MKSVSSFDSIPVSEKVTEQRSKIVNGDKNVAQKIRAFSEESLDDSDDIFDSPLEHTGEYVVVDDKKVAIDKERWGSSKNATPSSGDRIPKGKTPAPKEVPEMPERTKHNRKLEENPREKEEKEKREQRRREEIKERHKTDDVRAVDSGNIAEEQVEAKPLKVLDYADKVADDSQGMYLGLSHFAACFGDSRHFKKLLKRFEMGKLIVAGDFVFLFESGELMAYQYNGISMEVEIPAKVGGCPVKYIYEGLFNSNSMFSINKYKYRGVKSMLSGDYAGSFSRDNAQEIAAGIKKLYLPSTIEALPSSLLAGCPRVRELTIPDSVQYVSPKTFYGSKLDALFFEGYCPKNMHLCSFDEIPSIYVRKEYEGSFDRLLNNIYKFTGGN